MTSSESIQVDPKKIETVTNWLRPTTVTEVRSFLGLTSYCRRFVHNFSKIAAPLTKLTQKNFSFIWIDDCEESFQKLKECLTTAPMLTLPMSGEGYIVYCDASRVSLGSVLMQHGKVVA